MNSSPPRRASRSVSRSAPDSAAVTRFSSSSPIRWPSVSFTFLKRSRSMNSTPTRRPLRFAFAIACVRRSCSSSRLGRPVSASRVARYCSRSSAWIRDDTSCTNDRIETICPASSSSAEWYHSHQMVSPSRRWLRVRPVARGSSPCMRRATRPAKLSRSSSCTSGLVGERYAEDFLGRPAEDVLRLRRPADQPEIAIPFQHGQRRVADVRREHPVDALQLVLVALLVVDVGVHRIDADHVAVGVAVRRVVDGLPAGRTVRLHQFHFGRYRLAREHAVEQRAQLVRALAAHDVDEAPARDLLAALAQPVLVVAVEEDVAVVAVDVRNARRNVVDDETQLGLGGASAPPAPA